MRYGDTLGYVVITKSFRLGGRPVVAVYDDIESARILLRERSEQGVTCWLARLAYHPGSESNIDDGAAAIRREVEACTADEAQRAHRRAPHGRRH